MLLRNATSSTTPVAANSTMSATLTQSTTRARRERTSAMGASVTSVGVGRAALGGHAIAAPAQRLDGLVRVLGVELAAQAADEHLDDVAVALEVLAVERLGDLRLRQHFTGVQHQILEQLVLEAREVQLRVVDLDLLRARVERDRPAHELGLCPATGAAQQRVDAREQLL